MYPDTGNFIDSDFFDYFTSQTYLKLIVLKIEHQEKRETSVTQVYSAHHKLEASNNFGRKIHT